MFTDTNSIGKRVAKTSFALSAFALLTMMAAAAFAAPPVSESGKSKLAMGHWGGTYGDVWIPGRYDKSYNAAPTLNEAAKAKVADGHWSGTYGDVWKPGAYDGSYNTNPQLSDAARRKMSQGFWGGKNGNEWIQAGGLSR